MADTERVYMAALNRPGAVEYIKGNGINTYPGTQYTPLATNEADAIKRLLCDCKNNNTDTGKTVLVFCLDIPSYKLSKLMTAAEDKNLQGTFFYAYKGKVPPEYITDIEEAELFPMDN